MDTPMISVFDERYIETKRQAGEIRSAREVARIVVSKYDSMTLKNTNS